MPIQMPTPTSTVEKLIDNEILWCKTNTASAQNTEYARGFVDGLKQALFLARKDREG